ncbi:MAG: hypothetical protein A2V90_05625 [Gammaproteobacteria bacterium RBG_16_57_12]|nr:MAG: hypothetical protein A2V90_05625 [Gammaproteobacteria bacterium RBG_16_57_12]
MLLLLLCLLPPRPLLAEPVMRGFEAVYTLKRESLTIGQTVNTLSRDNTGRYVFESSTVPVGIAAMFVKDKIMERSLWTFHDNQPRPIEYLYDRSGGRKNRTVKLSFDWEKSIVTNVINDDPWQMKIEPGVQDKLLYQLAIAQELKQGKQHIQFQVADGGTTKTYEIGVQGEEPVATPLGNYQTIKVKRLNTNRSITIWFAKELEYLPVRIEYTGREGSHFIAQLKAVKFTNMPAMPVQ